MSPLVTVQVPGSWNFCCEMHTETFCGWESTVRRPQWARSVGRRYHQALATASATIG